MDKILVIDDDLQILENLRKLLKKKNYEVLCATNIEEGEKIALEKSPDLILSDIRLKDEQDYGGFLLLDKLKQVDLVPDTPFIFLSVLDETDDVIKGLELGAHDYINKPYDSKILLARIKIHLDLSHARSDLEKFNEKLVNQNKVVEQINFELTQQIEKFKDDGSIITPENLERTIADIINQYTYNPEIVKNYRSFAKDIPISMIENSEFKQLFHFLKLKTSKDKEAKKTVSVLKGNYNDLKKNYHRGKMDYTLYQQQLNDIRDRMFSLIDDIFE